MAINFYQATGGPKPKVEIEISLTAAVGMPSTSDRRTMYLMGPMGATAPGGTVDTVSALPFSSASDADDHFGTTVGCPTLAGYMAYQLFGYKNAKTGKAKCPVYGIGLTPPAGGTARIIGITFATTSTAAGTWTLQLWGHEWDVVVASGQTAIEQATSCVTAFNALTGENRPPFTASNGAGANPIVLLTAATKGLDYNGGGFGTVYDPGITTTVAWAGAGVAPGVLGAGVYTTTTAEANLASTALRQLVPSFNDDTTVELLIDLVNENSDATNMLGSRLILALEGDAATAVAAAAAMDNDDTERVSFAVCDGSNSHASHIAAEFAAMRASEPHLARSMDGLSFDTVAIPTDAGDRYTATEQVVLLEGGCSPVILPPGGKSMTMCRDVSVRTDLGVMDAALIDVLDYVRDYWAGLIATNLDRASIVSDTAVMPPVGHVTRPKDISSLLRSGAEDLELAGYLTNVETHWEDVVIELTGSTVKVLVPTEMVPQLHNVMIRIDSAVTA